MPNRQENDYKSTIMYREILEEPNTVIRTINSIKDKVKELSEVLRKSDLIYSVGSGTSYHASMIAQIRLLRAGFSSVAVRAPEFSHYIPHRRVKVSVILISQSGESVDILNALKDSRRRGYYTIGITNEVDSSLARNCDFVIATQAGTEKSLAATKSFIAQLIAIYVLTSSLMGERKREHELEKLLKVPDEIRALIEESNYLMGIARKIQRRVIFLGNGYLHAIALEGAMKFEETANLLTEAFPIGEYLHGPIQALRETDAVVILKGKNTERLNKVISRVSEISNKIFLVGQEPTDNIRVPAHIEYEFLPLFYVVPLQLLANFKSVSSGLNPDSPSRLSKIVK